MENTKIVRNVRESSGLRIAVLFGSFFMLLIVTTMFSAIINNSNVGDNRTHILLSAAIQCVLAFCLPAYFVARFSSNSPWNWLRLTKKISIKPILGVIIVYFLTLPSMEWLIEWNSNIHLPDSMSGLESTLRKLEDDAAATTSIILGAQGFGSILVGILVIGVLTGFSEELFFRGGLQKTLEQSGIGISKAIILASFIFSFMHFQFFGFIPRFLMGLFFGYLVVWTSDIKISMFAHILNNSLVVLIAGIEGNSDVANPETAILPQNDWLPLISIIASTIFFIYFRGYFFQNKKLTIWRKSQLPPVTGI